MSTNPAFDPTVKELPASGDLDGAVVTASVTADASGWFYKPGTTVTIGADRTFKAAGSTDKVVGVVKHGLYGPDIGGAIPANARILVGVYKGRRIDIVTAAEALTAGDEVVINYQGKASKPTGSTPPAAMGIVWKGAASGSEAEVLIY